MIANIISWMLIYLNHANLNYFKNEDNNISIDRTNLPICPHPPQKAESLLFMYLSMFWNALVETFEMYLSIFEIYLSNWRKIFLLINLSIFLTLPPQKAESPSAGQWATACGTIAYSIGSMCPVPLSPCLPAILWLVPPPPQKSEIFVLESKL